MKNTIRLSCHEASWYIGLIEKSLKRAVDNGPVYKIGVRSNARSYRTDAQITFRKGVAILHGPGRRQSKTKEIPANTLRIEIADFSKSIFSLKTNNNE